MNRIKKVNEHTNEIEAIIKENISSLSTAIMLIKFNPREIKNILD